MSSSQELKKQKSREYSARYKAKNIRGEADARYRAKNLLKRRESNRIANWEARGVECDDEWDEVYDWYIDTTHCNICDKEFVHSNDKCLDHDHDLEGYNVRSILCKKCNNVVNEL